MRPQKGILRCTQPRQLIGLYKMWAVRELVIVKKYPATGSTLPPCRNATACVIWMLLGRSWHLMKSSRDGSFATIGSGNFFLRRVENRRFPFLTHISSRTQYWALRTYTWPDEVSLIAGQKLTWYLYFSTGKIRNMPVQMEREWHFNMCLRLRDTSHSFVMWASIVRWQFVATYSTFWPRRWVDMMEPAQLNDMMVA